jgi:hypothetical protein
MKKIILVSVLGVAMFSSVVKAETISPYNRSRILLPRFGAENLRDVVAAFNGFLGSRLHSCDEVLAQVRPHSIAAE